VKARSRTGYNDFDFDFDLLRRFLERTVNLDGTVHTRQELLAGLSRPASSGAEQPAERKQPSSELRRSRLSHFLSRIQEVFASGDDLFMTYRPGVARHTHLRLRRGERRPDVIGAEEYLSRRDALAPGAGNVSRVLHIDFSPFQSYLPLMRDSGNIGRGMRFLGRHLASSFFQSPEKWSRILFDFLKLHSVQGQSLLISGEKHRDDQLFLGSLDEVIDVLGRVDSSTPEAAVRDRLRSAGFEPGWGFGVGRIVETMELLRDLFVEPSTAALQEFISRIPMVSKVAVVSPHGWFGQDKIWGKPDTGGQVIYILDQVRSLEAYLKEHFTLAGLDIRPRIVVLTRLIPDAQGTSCDRELEKIYDTEDSWILRVPFRGRGGRPLHSWISRFKVWPYLERFAEESEGRLRQHLEGRPDLLIGNYSDGNLVASLLSDAFGVTLCTIAHALEKTKYRKSDHRWRELDDTYHFSIQFAADLLSMNKADFIVTSTFQEIGGTDEVPGQYESHASFSLPGLYRVTSGVNLLHPKFNIIPPGVDDRNYFPFYLKDRRRDQGTEAWERRLFTERADDVFGELEAPSRAPLFTMARLDRIKNISGLVEAFGRNEELSRRANLIFAAGTTRVDESGDEEERAEIQKIYGLVERYDLHGRVRWLPSIDKSDTGEVYRIVADRRGVFVQPALFEGFGLTVLEAMLSGLPTFATIHGGPSEIVEDGRSGFLIEPGDPASMSQKILSFLRRVEADPGVWKAMSDAGIQRVLEHFTWQLYSQKLMSLTKVYGFWRYAVAERGKRAFQRYWEALYHLLVRLPSERMDREEEGASGDP